jgi:SAM-dependent methyltransferase
MRIVTKLRNGAEQLWVLLRRTVRGAFGLHTSLTTDDRVVLEGTILPWFAEREQFGRILFVGCDWYTKHYEELFVGREYWTLEKDPRRSRYGASRHVVDTLRNLAEHFAPGSLDLVICNGVLGWGLNDREEAELSLEAVHGCLREGGVLVLGWNDIPERRVLVPDESRSLDRFRPWIFRPLAVSQHLTHTRNRHTFSFFEK